MNSYLDLNFDVVHAATNNRYAGVNGIRLVNLGSISLFSNYNLTTLSDKHLEDISHAHIVSLMYKLITSAKNTNDFSICFDKDRVRRQRQLTNNKTQKGKYHVRIYLKDVFGFAEHQLKATYGLGYILTLTRDNDKAVLNKENATVVGKVRINAIEWYVPHYTPSISQQTILFNQIKNKTPTELQYVERSVFMKEVNTQNLWSFEIGTHEGVNIPIWIIIGFQQRERQDSQNMNNDTFYRPPVTSAQGIIAPEKYPDSAFLLKYDDDDYNQGYGQIKEAFKAQTKDDILQPYKSDNDFRSSNNNNDIGYNLYVFGIRYQKTLENAQPIKVEVKFDGVIPAGIYGYASVLTNTLLSISSDGQRHFDLI